MKWFIKSLIPQRIPPGEELDRQVRNLVAGGLDREQAIEQVARNLGRFRNAIRGRLPMPSQAEVRGMARQYTQQGMTVKQAIERVSDDLGRHPMDIVNHLKASPAEAATTTIIDRMEPMQRSIKIKQLIQNNINYIRMVIGACFIVPGLFLITDSYHNYGYGNYRAGISSTIIDNPFWFTIGILLLISGAIILAKGVREYLR